MIWNHGPAFLAAVSLISSSSIVSLIPQPFVSGRKPANNPAKNIAVPNTPKDRNLLRLPIATITGATAPPSTITSLTTAIAEFLTQVGNNSTLYIITTLHAVQAAKNDANSTAISNHPPPAIKIQTMLQIPLTVVNATIELRLFIHRAIKNAASDDGSSATAFSAVLR
ncbi:hypothetical protein IEQ34_001214 [Dendrobium chrysotoxum]|uniref:Uncharacterized protein n=1 Tax=Dendrobium chrysotoxum TaxID=161865 RepID=A0AAV7HLX5_DENCH|nr:hypothetical protein IEQ34_001214 [Dendrobium chrysotoxum]